MKIYIILIFIIPFLFCNCLSNLSLHSDSSLLYKDVVNYIKKDSLAKSFIKGDYSANRNIPSLRIVISPLIMSPQISYFGSTAVKKRINFNLCGKQFNYNDHIQDSLIKYEQQIEYAPFIDKKITQFSAVDSAEAIVFFSKAYSNFVTAILFHINSSIKDTELPQFGPSLYYLFIFTAREL